MFMYLSMNFSSCFLWIGDFLEPSRCYFQISDTHYLLLCLLSAKVVLIVKKTIQILDCSMSKFAGLAFAEAGDKRIENLVSLSIMRLAWWVL